MLLTRNQIEEMANEIANYCYENGHGDVIMYYNNKRRYVDYYGYERDEIDRDVNPHDYIDYCAYEHIFTMSSEGSLDLEYEIFEKDNGIQKIFNKYGVYAELGNYWNLSCYSISDDMVVEYTIYKRPAETIYIYRNNIKNFPTELQKLGEIFDSQIINYKNTCGSCVIGDGIKFDYKDKSYFFSTNYNQSEAPYELINTLKRYLFEIGAMNIVYDCGRLD